jgi:beta-lactamase superfamily II metal-dependent hydrolase
MTTNATKADAVPEEKVKEYLAQLPRGSSVEELASAYAAAITIDSTVTLEDLRRFLHTGNPLTLGGEGPSHRAHITKLFERLGKAAKDSGQEDALLQRAREAVVAELESRVGIKATEEYVQKIRACPRVTLDSCTHLRTQHAVGHGFFHCGQIELEGMNPFTYVYDCGARKLRTLLAPALSDFSAMLAHPNVHLLVLSHFHTDHANGLDELFSFVEVDTAVIPYVSPMERLLIVAELLASRRGGSDAIERVAYPEGWLRRHGVRRVVTIRPHENGDGAPVPSEPSESSRTGFRDGWDLFRGDASVGDGEVFEHSEPLSVAFSRAVLMEFLFFCHRSPGTLERFEGEWRSRGATHLDLANPQSWITDRARRRSLVACYAAATQGSLNLTTLCARASPLGDDWGHWYDRDQTAIVPWRAPGPAPSVLLTGDLELGRPEVAEAFFAHYEKQPRPVSTLSLPHHGSIHNFDDGLVSRLGPRLVLATCPNRSKDHPHSDVVRRVRAASSEFHKVDERPRSALRERIVIRFTDESIRHIPPSRSR